MSAIKHRELAERLKINLFAGERLFVYGPHRSGRTTLIADLAASAECRSLSLDLALETERELFSREADGLITRLNTAGYRDSENFLLLLDNIQFRPGLIPLLDRLPENVQCVCTSDNREDAFDEENVLYNMLRIFRIGSLTFREYLHFAEADDLLKFLPDEVFAASEMPDQADAERLTAHYQKYLIYGGYPETVEMPAEDVVDEFFPNVILPRLEKNLPASFGVKKRRNFFKFLVYLAQFQGEPFNESGAARLLGHRFETLETWKLILMNNGIMQRVKPWFHYDNPNEIRRYDKFYLFDTGLRNALLNNFNDFSRRFDIKELIAQVTAAYFSEHPHWECFYYQTKQGQCLDFLLKDDFSILPLEIRLGGSKGSYIKRYSKRDEFDTGCIINMDQLDRQDNILSIPAWMF